MDDFYEPQDYEAYEDDNSSKKISLLINIMIIIIICYIVFVIIGMLNTDYINGDPQVVDISERKEIAYVKQIDEYIYDLQRISNNTYKLYNLYIQNNSSGIKDGYKNLSSYILSVDIMLQEIRNIQSPERFLGFHEDFIMVLRTRIEADTALLNYLKRYNPKYLEKYNYYHQMYRKSFRNTNMLWQRLQKDQRFTNMIEKEVL